MKVCSRCKVEKVLTSFSKAKSLPLGLKSACKVCASEDFQRWKSKQDIEVLRYEDRIRHYKRKYNLPEDKAIELVTNRIGECSICKNTMPLVVDHCHTTGLVRGFICSACNSMLGYSRDNTKTLKAAIAYLENIYGK